MTTIELRAISVGVDVGGRTLLNDINLLVSSGQMIAITGHSGSGKSVLAHTLAGIIEPDRGEVSHDGAPLTVNSPFSARPALVPQDFGLVSVLTCGETVALPLQVRSLPKEEIRERVAIWLGALGLESCAKRTVAELSGGQRQRVAIARALAIGADAIVLDEPTAELDPANRALVLSLLVAELARGAALVVVSHEADVIAQADFVYELPTLL
ncbi:MAG: ATP-binding cassette domain-containing protein [Acidimicrobiales bacterium]